MYGWIFCISHTTQYGLAFSILYVFDFFGSQRKKQSKQKPTSILVTGSNQENIPTDKAERDFFVNVNELNLNNNDRPDQNLIDEA